MKQLFLALILFITILGCDDTKTKYEIVCEGVECSGHGECTVKEDRKAICVCDKNFHAEGLECNANTLQCGVTEHEEAGICVSNRKMIDCIDVTPANATTMNIQTEITWENGTWSNADNCDFTCVEGYNKVGTSCVENTVVCEANSCTELHKTVCNAESGKIVCSCDTGYMDDGGNCVLDDMTYFYQNPDSSNNAILNGDFTNWGADESQMDKVKMNSLIITAYPTTVTGHDYGAINSIDVLPKNANSGDVAKIRNTKYIYSGLENKWVEGLELNNKTTTSTYEYLLPLRTIAEQSVSNGGGTLYLPKGIYENQIYLASIYNNTPHDFLINFRIIGDGIENTILDTSYIDDSTQTHFESNAISIAASSSMMIGLKNIIISDLTIKTYGQAIDIYSHTEAIGDNILIKNLKIIKVSQNYYSVISFNRSLLMTLSRVTLDNISTTTSNGGFCMHGLAFFKGKYIKIHNSNFNTNPSEYNIDIHAQFIEVSNTNLTKTKSSGRPNIKFPGSNYILFNKVHFKSKSEREGNVMVSSSPERYNLHFEGCTFETPSPAIFTTYGHIGYGLKQFVLKNNKIIGAPTEFQIYGADKVYLNGNTKNGESIDTIFPFTYDRYHLTTYDFEPLNKIKETFTTNEAIDHSIGYKSWNNNSTNKTLCDSTLMNTEISINLPNIHIARNQTEFENLITSINSSPLGGTIKIEANTSIVVDTITLNKIGIVGKGTLTVNNILLDGESYIGEGLNLNINNKMIVDGTLVLNKVNINKSADLGTIIEGKNRESKIIIHSSNISGGKDIITGKANFVFINGETVFSNYNDKAISVSTNFLNILDTVFKNGNYGIYIGDVKNIYIKRVSVVDILKPIYLGYHLNTKVIEISDINSNTDNVVETSTSYDSELIDISIGRLKTNGSYNDVTLITPSAEYAYSYNGVRLIPAIGKTYQEDDHRTGGGNISPYHIPIGYFPAEWNYLNPNEVSFPRP